MIIKLHMLYVNVCLVKQNTYVIPCLLSLLFLTSLIHFLLIFLLTKHNVYHFKASICYCCRTNTPTNTHQVI